METNQEFKTKNYEIAFLGRDESIVATLTKLLKQHEFEVVGEGTLKKITLAYKIKKEEYGHFGYLHFAGNPENLSALSHNLKTNPSLIRFLIVTPPFVKTKSPITNGFKPRIKAPSPKIDLEERPSLPISNEALEKKIEEILQ
ncbi:MAG: 30S ribosomal protein S6 [Candidatus Liptonbacteria bacterium]|nr:30S ribosomal protein S6 [Candidatus Liptonbacteria bacterium]